MVSPPSEAPGIHAAALVLLIVLGAGTYAGPVPEKTEASVTDQSSHENRSPDSIANHTAAVVELVLQNLHRIKNFQERERLEKLVTRFKTLVDELESQQLRSDMADVEEEEELDDPPVMPDDDAPSQFKFPLHNVQRIPENEKPDSHRGQLSLTLLPQTEQIKRKDANMESKNVQFHESVTSSALLATENSHYTPSSPQLGESETNTQVLHPIQNAKDDEGTEGEDEEDSQDEDDEQLVAELRQGSQMTQFPAKINKQTNAYNLPPKNDDQLIEVNAKPYPRTNQIVDSYEDGSEDLARAWDPPLGARKMGRAEEIPRVDDETSSSDFQAYRDPQQLDADVKLLSKVIGSLRQVKDLLRRMRHDEEIRR